MIVVYLNTSGMPFISRTWLLKLSFSLMPLIAFYLILPRIPFQMKLIILATSSSFSEEVIFLKVILSYWVIELDNYFQSEYLTTSIKFSLQNAHTNAFFPHPGGPLKIAILAFLSFMKFMNSSFFFLWTLQVSIDWGAYFS